MGREEGDTGVSTVTRKKVRTHKPRLYKVILLNDDYTTTDFVVAILESIFQKSPAEAVAIMLQVHRGGRGVCGVFSRQIAEAKVELVHKRAKAQGYPLRCVMEEA
jgi:ATP-dependent Clp protease adaptor protein ClpS